MKENKWAIAISLPFSIFGFVVIITEQKINYSHIILNLTYSILGSALLLLFISTVGYNVSKKNALVDLKDKNRALCLETMLFLQTKFSNNGVSMENIKDFFLRVSNAAGELLDCLGRYHNGLIFPNAKALNEIDESVRAVYTEGTNYLLYFGVKSGNDLVGIDFTKLLNDLVRKDYYDKINKIYDKQFKVKNNFEVGDNKTFGDLQAELDKTIKEKFTTSK